MLKFYYIARNNLGAKETGVEEGLNQEEVVSKIQSRGLIVISVIPENTEAFNSKEINPNVKVKFKQKRDRITGADLTLFCRQLSTLLGAGVTILKSLDIISKQVVSRKFYAVVVNLQKNMEAGLSFHEAMVKHPKVFSDLWVNLVESGEASGNLAVVLSRLATYLERDAEFRGKVISALIYPGILLFAGLGALFLMAVKIVPTFAEIFKGFNITLPLLTRILLMVSDFLRFNTIAIFLVIGGIVFTFKSYLKTKTGRRNFESFKFKMPVFGEFFMALNVERFSSEMSTLLESGVPILYSLEISERSVGNLVMADIIRKIKDDVREGKSLREPLEKSAFFDPMFIQMVSIGEEIGELPQMFKKINNFYQDYCGVFLTRFVSMFEPFVLVFIGGIIGLMITGIFLPIFEISKIGG
ncbi:MAG: type II secretion system F family protein [Candidatus Omnitrophica bacterium]|nr:type II secretion system F family protein [Candidatus Omnitrophota bacterium]MBU1922860.1 type II secretion system F family protein [Candidatus Omnitrophota bacterium]